jgi:hypothetical protein
MLPLMSSVLWFPFSKVKRQEVHAVSFHRIKARELTIEVRYGEQEHNRKGSCHFFQRSSGELGAFLQLWIGNCAK